MYSANTKDRISKALFLKIIIILVFYFAEAYAKKIIQNNFDSTYSALNFKFKKPIAFKTIDKSAVRSDPFTSSSVKFWIPKGNSIKIIGKVFDFYHISYNDKIGYLHFLYVDKTYESFKSARHDLIAGIDSSASVIYATVFYDADINKKPNFDSKSIGKVKNLSVIEVEQSNETYWLCKINNHIGYISTTYLHPFGSPSIPRIYSKDLLTNKISETRNYYNSYVAERFMSLMKYTSNSMADTPTTGASVYTGPRGGHYYFNSRGNKTYIKHR